MPQFVLGELYGATVSAIKARIDNGEWTERALGRICGISQPHIHHILSGKRRGRLDCMDALCRACHLELEEVLAQREAHRAAELAARSLTRAAGEAHARHAAAAPGPAESRSTAA